MSAAGAKVLVTGANGFVGSAVARVAAAAGWRVTRVARRKLDGSPDVRVCDYSIASLSALIQEVEPACIVHGAGAASVAASVENPDADFSSSVALMQRLLEGVRRSGRHPLLVYASSAAVYGNPATLPVEEGAPLKPISPYGFHKMMCERLMEEYAAWYGQPGLCMRAFSLLGETQRRLLIWDVFRKALAGPVELSGTGEESRDYLHVDDYARLLLVAAQRHPGGFDALNAASGRAVTVREVAERILAITGRPGPLSFNGKVRPGDPKEWRADVARLEKRVGALGLPAFEERLAQLVRAWNA
jgi:UDP-glucose 4-epimerase